MRLAAAWLVALIVLGACTDDEPASVPSTESTTTTTTAGTGTTPATSTSTSTTTQATSTLALRGDGLGVVDLGAPLDEAIAAVSAELGAPSADTGWEEASAYGACPGDEIRAVEWGGLVLLFTDGETPYGNGEHLFTWRVTGAPPAVATADGLGYGATATDAEELYPGMVDRVPAEDPFPSFLRIAGDGGQIIAIVDDADTITNLEGGPGCGE